MRTLGIFSKVGMPGGSENRVVQLANCFSTMMPTFIFAEKHLSSKLKPQLKPEVILRENIVEAKNKKSQYELSGMDMLIIVNSDSYSFTKPSYWDGTQGKHHKINIDISQIPKLCFLFNYVVGPARALVKLYEINKSIKIFVTSNWFAELLKMEKKFEKFRKLKLPVMTINSPISPDYYQQKTPSKKIRINRHSMGFAYEHDEDNLKVVKHLCEKYGDKISFNWMGVPSQVRDIDADSKDKKVPYKKVLEKYKQFKVSKEYSISVPAFLRDTDIHFSYISRFRKEPWPRTVAEAMMAGCCCVTNNAHGMKEQVQHKKTGYLFNSTEEAIDQLEYLIENPEETKQIGQNAHSYASEHFVDTKICEQMLSFVQ